MPERLGGQADNRVQIPVENPAGCSARFPAWKISCHTSAHLPSTGVQTLWTAV
jgi:hypothetical protein